MNGLFPIDDLLLLDILFEGDALNVFHDDILQPVTEAHVIHLDDIRVRQDRDRLRLIFEAAAELLIGKKFFFEDFNCNDAIINIVIGFIDHRHTAHADDLADLISTV